MREEYRQYYRYQTTELQSLLKVLSSHIKTLGIMLSPSRNGFIACPGPTWVLGYRPQDNRCYYVFKSSLGSLSENLWKCLIKMAFNQLLQNNTSFIFPFLSSKHVPVSFFWFILDGLSYPTALDTTILQTDHWLLTSLFSVLTKQLCLQGWITEQNWAGSHW